MFIASQFVDEDGATALSVSEVSDKAVVTIAEPKRGKGHEPVVIAATFTTLTEALAVGGDYVLLDGERYDPLLTAERNRLAALEKIKAAGYSSLEEAVATLL